MVQNTFRAPWLGPEPGWGANLTEEGVREENHRPSP